MASLGRRRYRLGKRPAREAFQLRRGLFMNAAARIVLLGASGQVGTELRSLLEGTRELHALTRAEADLSQPEKLRPILRDLKPEIIVNAAAYTAVDQAESEP